jgi:hypothetical protein
LLFLGVVQARDLLLETPGSTADELGFFNIAEMAIFAGLFGFMLLVVWAMPVHAVARICLNRTEWLKSPYRTTSRAADLDEARQAFEAPARLVPRILGCGCFVVAALGVVLAGYDLPKDPSARMSALLHPALYILSLAGFLVVFLLYAIRRRRWSERRMATHGGAEVEIDTSGSPRPKNAAGMGRAGPLEFWDRVSVWGLTGLLVLVLAVTPILDYVVRSFLVLVLLGVWVPALGFLGSLSFRTRVPMITLAIAVIAALDFFIGDNHDIDQRSIHKASGPQLHIRDAVARWRSVNGCENTPGNCPSPVIVVAAGGASRAAFMTASTLGLLLDASCLDLKPASNGNAASECDQPPAMAQRLFAISSVSGSSLGAAVYAKAYADGISRSNAGYKTAPPCKNNVSSSLWFGNGKILTWRDCLQAILAEDFLSPVFAGLGFRDVFAFFGGLAPDWWRDRGYRLEQSWINAYNRFVPVHSVKVGDATYAGLDVPFSSLVPSQEKDAPWRPLLLLNATSVETGRRIVTSHLAPKYFSDPACPSRTKARNTGKPECVRLFTDAYDMHEVLNKAEPGNCVIATEPLQLGFSLASAAHNSARFPIVSPAGNILADGKKKSLGRVVDGGYFDNYGALTAFDLADTLRWDFDLHPFVLLITNDPADNPNQKAPSEIKAGLRQFGSLVAAPVDTVLAARSGHGSTAVKFLRGLVDPQMYQDKSCEAVPQAMALATSAGAPVRQNGEGKSPGDRSCFGIEQTGMPGSDAEPCFAHISIGPPEATTTATGKPMTAPQVSMSWWLSKPVQRYLNDRLGENGSHNEKALQLICETIIRGRPEKPVKDQATEDQCNRRIKQLTSGKPE